jgi:hypothetical protein
MPGFVQLRFGLKKESWNQKTERDWSNFSSKLDK